MDSCVSELIARIGILQVQDRIRVVTASEYDHALRHCPSACPLAVMGDLRSGQELIDSAHADAKQSIKDILSSDEGLHELNQSFKLAKLPFYPKSHKLAAHNETC